MGKLFQTSSFSDYWSKDQKAKMERTPRGASWISWTSSREFTSGTARSTSARTPASQWARRHECGSQGLRYIDGHLKVALLYNTRRIHVYHDAMHRPEQDNLLLRCFPLHGKMEVLGRGSAMLIHDSSPTASTYPRHRFGNGGHKDQISSHFSLLQLQSSPDIFMAIGILERNKNHST